MINITDYVRKYGNRSLDDLPFGEVDSLILSQLSYLKFDSVIFIDETVTLRQISRRPGIDDAFLDKRYEKINRELFQAASESVRYGNMYLKNYVNIVDPKKEIQFCAVTFLFPGKLAYVAFRGTDDSITGWKEDFNMVYESPVPAQLHALSYLNNIVDRLGSVIYVGGHSKGGNLAVYSCAKLSDEKKSKIKRIYSHDGPGFTSGTITDIEKAFVRKHLRKSVPASSIVGMLLTETDDLDVVECKGVALMQHNPFNWAISDHRFKRDKLRKRASMQDESINRWLISMSEDELKVFVKTVFELFDKAGVTNVNEFYYNLGDVILRMAKAADNIDEDRKQLMHAFLRQLVISGRKTPFEGTVSEFLRLHKDFSEFIRNLQDRINGNPDRINGKQGRKAIAAPGRSARSKAGVRGIQDKKDT
ncbi:MAG: DUF2974 domain-containing protein [Lachnospiraceae bacterium]|nr:DUF2974 domain-containing protein [Lachnospiraceae bacterium]